MDVPLPTPVAVVLGACLLLAFIDFFTLKIHNVFTYPLLLAGLCYHGMAGGLAGLSDGLLGSLLGFAILVPFYALGGMGGSDVKLMAAVGAWLGLPLTFAVFLASGLAAGVYSLVLLVESGRVREAWFALQVGWLRARALGRRLAAEERIETAVSQSDRRRRVIPFAPMVVLGLVAVLLVVHVLSRP